MPVPSQPAEPAPPRRRADAERNVERIVEAAVDALGDDDEVSMAAIAARAGVARATLYAHFPAREALLEAVTQQALEQVTAVIAAAEPGRGEPAAALARVIGETWRTLGRYHAVIGINVAQGHDALRARHGSVLGALEPLFRRGQADGAFRAEVPVAWHLSTVMALVHAASGELRAGRLPEAGAEAVVVATVLGAVGAERPSS
jgi:AcrR family transcriptional regulator